MEVDDLILPFLEKKSLTKEKQPLHQSSVVSKINLQNIFKNISKHIFQKNIHTPKSRI